MLGLRLPELLIILVVVVLMFGAKKLPELGESLGKGIKAFKNATEHGLAGDDAAKDDKPTAGSSDPVPPKDEKRA